MNCPARIVPPVPAPKPAPTHVQKTEQKFITTGGEHASGYTQGGQVVVEEVDEIDEMLNVLDSAHQMRVKPLLADNPEFF
jgi:hypothetical protein